LFVARDEEWDQTKALITECVRCMPREPRLAANCESRARLRRFVMLGDPFVRTVFGTGRILRDKDASLAELRALCCDPDSLPAPQETVRYLRSKARFHHRRVHDHLQQLQGDLQLSLMARAQSVAIQKNGLLSPETFFDLSVWTVLERILRESGMPAELTSEAGRLIAAHKNPDATGLFADFRQRFSNVAQELERSFMAQDGQ